MGQMVWKYKLGGVGDSREHRYCGWLGGLMKLVDRPMVREWFACKEGLSYDLMEIV